MTWEMYALAAVASYALAGIAYSSRLRCWARGHHDEVRMFVKRAGHVHLRDHVYHCKWCASRRPAS